MSRKNKLLIARITLTVLVLGLFVAACLAPAYDSGHSDGSRGLELNGWSFLIVGSPLVYEGHRLANLPFVVSL